MVERPTTPNTQEFTDSITMNTSECHSSLFDVVLWFDKAGKERPNNEEMGGCYLVGREETDRLSSYAPLILIECHVDADSSKNEMCIAPGTRFEGLMMQITMGYPNIIPFKKRYLRLS